MNKHIFDTKRHITRGMVVRKVSNCKNDLEAGITEGH